MWLTSFSAHPVQHSPSWPEWLSLWAQVVLVLMVSLVWCSTHTSASLAVFLTSVVCYKKPSLTLRITPYASMVQFLKIGMAFLILCKGFGVEESICISKVTDTVFVKSCIPKRWWLTALILGIDFVWSGFQCSLKTVQGWFDFRMPLQIAKNTWMLCGFKIVVWHLEHRVDYYPSINLFGRACSISFLTCPAHGLPLSMQPGKSSEVFGILLNSMDFESKVVMRKVRFTVFTFILLWGRGQFHMFHSSCWYMFFRLLVLWLHDT